MHILIAMESRCCIINASMTPTFKMAGILEKKKRFTQTF